MITLLTSISSLRPITRLPRQVCQISARGIRQVLPLPPPSTQCHPFYFSAPRRKPPAGRYCGHPKASLFPCRSGRPKLESRHKKSSRMCAWRGAPRSRSLHEILIADGERWSGHAGEGRAAGGTGRGRSRRRRQRGAEVTLEAHGSRDSKGGTQRRRGGRGSQHPGLRWAGLGL